MKRRKIARKQLHNCHYSFSNELAFGKGLADSFKRHPFFLQGYATIACPGKSSESPVLLYVFLGRGERPERHHETASSGLNVTLRDRKERTRFLGIEE